MKEHPILFSAPMVRALLAGQKTQTRRAVKPQSSQSRDAAFVGTDGIWRFSHPTLRGPISHEADDVRCPYGVPGDRLYVKEATWMWCERQPNGTTPTGRKKWRYAPMREAGVFYCADHPAKPSVGVVSPDTGNQWGWRLKIGRFMPRWASRITLEIVSVRIERLQDISEPDAKAEGIHKQPTTGWYSIPGISGAGTTARAAYALLWNSINGPGSWAANPWVWVVEFRRVG